ncbi:hypothetical protein LOD99_1287 [Oopsacas minuta]|uniref:Uncharacterized protein n=1 Tax=Oopsacas minuta TaxID=111878 RepID=A0AAV7K690_9METZ|nr:hypothetical protein LOD99_1287 [Oopsacas minuta]
MDDNSITRSLSSSHNSTHSSTRGDKICSSIKSDSKEISLDSKPSKFGFLCQNVRFLNQPICSLVGDQKKVDYRQQFKAQNVSLISPDTSDKIPPPKYTKDSTQRQDYPNFSEVRPERPMCVAQQPAQGIVPGVSSDGGNQKREKISYEHNYDSRIDSNYPPRGKRLGSFV